MNRYSRISLLSLFAYTQHATPHAKPWIQTFKINATFLSFLFITNLKLTHCRKVY